MKTFSELISWELEQEAKQKTSQIRLTADGGTGKLNASVLRKLRYLNAAGASVPKSPTHRYSSI